MAQEKEKIHVYLRVRPINSFERDTGDVKIWEIRKDSIDVNMRTYNRLVAQNSKKLNFVVNQNKLFSYSTRAYSLPCRQVLRRADAQQRRLR